MSENKSSCSQKEKKEKEGDTPKIPERCKEEFEDVKYCFSRKIGEFKLTTSIQ